MSRTIRRRGVKRDYYWVLRESCLSEEELSKITDAHFVTNTRWGGWTRYQYDAHYYPYSKEGKRRIAQYHSDAGTNTCKEPGPSWYRNLYTERPLRRKAKRELKKYMLDTDYEPIIEKMGKLEYWT